MERRVVIRLRGDARRGQVLRDPVALRRADDVDVVDVTRIVLGQVTDLAQAERGISGGRLAPRAIPFLEMREEDAKERSLELVEPRVVADELELLLLA